MAELSEFHSDTRAINDGAWVTVDEARYGDLEILIRGFHDEFVDAQNAVLARASEKYGGDVTRIPNNERRLINAKLVREHLLVDVRNLTRDGQAVPVEEFAKMLSDPAWARLLRACWEAAAKVTAKSDEETGAAVGNSPGRSESISTGAGYAPD